ncbi:MAG TPA: polysaccharide deacetylase family protein, partial [Methylothermaceae bacterium]|nr:polysaccharide deacetylase family protein [Methylothermaceae bacterium]
MNRFLILMYHMIREPEDRREARYACPPDRFRRHLEALRRWGYQPVSLERIQTHLESGEPLPARSVAITLDDGFEDNYRNAFPILQDLAVPATLFLATGHLEKTNAWMRGWPQHPMLNWNQIREMHRHGIGFGGHTVSHCHLDQVDEDRAREEIEGCRHTIEDRLGTACDHFAYPYGRFTDATVALVRRAGYRLACSTRSGFNHRGRDPFILHRIEVRGDDALWKLKQKLTFGTNEAGVTLPLRYYASRLA